MCAGFFDRPKAQFPINANLTNLSVRFLEDTIKTLRDILSIVDYFTPNFVVKAVVAFLDGFIGRYDANQHNNSPKP